MADRNVKVKSLPQAIKQNLNTGKAVQHDNLCSLCRRQTRTKYANGAYLIATLRNAQSNHTIHVLSTGGLVCSKCLVEQLAPSVGIRL